MTIKEIAQMCGVSRGTVDRVLNHRGRVKPETEQAVVRALQQAGYTKNIAGRALTVGRQGTSLGVVLCGRGNPFLDEVLQGIAQAEEELQTWGVGVEVRSLPGYDAQAQVQAMEELGASCAALVVQPVNDEQVKREIATLTQRGIPVLTLNSDLEGSPRAVYVGSDYYRGGQAAAGMVNLWREDGAVLGIVAGSQAILGHTQRLLGFQETLKGKHQVVELFHGEDDPAQIYRKTGDMLRRHPAIQGIFVVAAGCASACRAVIDGGRAEQVSVFGFDLVPENAEMMRRGIIKALICQQPQRQGREAVQAAWRLLLHQSVTQEKIWMEHHICIRENMEQQ